MDSHIRWVKGSERRKTGLTKCYGLATFRRGWHVVGFAWPVRYEGGQAGGSGFGSAAAHVVGPRLVNRHLLWATASVRRWSRKP
jgi:hypothetical protein